MKEQLCRLLQYVIYQPEHKGKTSYKHLPKKWYTMKSNANCTTVLTYSSFSGCLGLVKSGLSA